MAENKKPKSDTDNASGTADVPPQPDDDPLSDAHLDGMDNTGTTWGRYRNRR